MNPHLRDLVIVSVALMVAAALLILSLLTRSVTLFVVAALASALIAAGATVFAFVQSWRWSQRLSAAGHGGQSLGVAVLGGLAILVAGAALAGAAWVVLLFFLG